MQKLFARRPASPADPNPNPHPSLQDKTQSRVPLPGTLSALGPYRSLPPRSSEYPFFSGRWWGTGAGEMSTWATGDQEQGPVPKQLWDPQEPLAGPVYSSVGNSCDILPMGHGGAQRCSSRGETPLKSWPSCPRAACKGWGAAQTGPGRWKGTPPGPSNPPSSLRPTETPPSILEGLPHTTQGRL